MQLNSRSWFSLCVVFAPACIEQPQQIGTVESAVMLPNNSNFTNDEGVSRDFSTNGAMDLSSPFFQSLGTNGRTCGSCHAPDNGWTVSVAGIDARFDATDGTDPIFRTNDGANSPDADV